MAVIRVEREIAGRTLSFETGRMAKQSHGAVTVQYGDTVVLVTVLTAPAQREVDFFPLVVDYRENQYSAGKIPGGFFKREGRPSTKEILTMRLIDRPIRPLFPYDFMDEVQIQAMVLSTDNQNDPDLLAVIGTSAALAICPAPFEGPVAASRIGHIDGELVVNPTHDQLEQSDMELVIAGPSNAPNMIEFSGMEVPEELVEQAIKLGYEAYLPVIEMIQELADKVGVKKAYQPTPIPQDLLDLIYAKCGERIRQAKQIPGKQERNEAVAAIKQEIKEELCPEGVEELQYTPMQVGEAFYRTEGKIQRELILSGTRPDGRGYGDVRPLEIEVGVLPRTHGSSIFARGETQCLATATLGTPRDQQIVDGLQDEYKKPFMLHYNFPPFCVGEVRPIRGPGRREIGHGALAEKSIQAVMPSNDSFPYTVRVVADMMESNGSTSMATVCGGCMALMDAGVPITRPVAGISIGMVSEGSRYQLLTDIIGEEDFHGDMDFKVAGSSEGITGIQLDMKSRGLPIERMGEVLEQARQARLSILKAMTGVLEKSREDISAFAPRIMTIQINPDKIGKVIGPGGKTINKIQDETGATIDINDDGTIYISSTDAAAARTAKDFIEGLTATVEVGRIYEGKVVSIRDFGAFIEILPGQDGLCHVSELDAAFVKNVTDVCQVGDVLKVKVIAIDDQGRVKLSRKVLMEGGDKPSGDSGKHEGSGRHGHEKKKSDHKKDRKH